MLERCCTLIVCFAASSLSGQEHVRPKPDKYDRGQYKERYNDAAKGKAPAERDARAPRNAVVKADKYDRGQYKDRFNKVAAPPDNGGGGGGGKNGGGGGGNSAPPAGPKPSGPKGPK